MKEYEALVPRRLVDTLRVDLVPALGADSAVAHGADERGLSQARQRAVEVLRASTENCFDLLERHVRRG